MISDTLIKNKFLRIKDKSDFKLTRLWDEVALSIKEVVLQYTKFEEFETPIIVYYNDQQHWWLITNNALYINNLAFSGYKFKEIDKVDIAPLWNGEINKTEVSTIQIYGKGKQIDLTVEPLSWPVVFNILQFLVGK